MSKFLTPQEISDRLRIPLSTIRQWISARKFPVTKIGKHVFVTEADLEAWIKAHRQPALPHQPSSSAEKPRQ